MESASREKRLETWWLQPRHEVAKLRTEKHDEGPLSDLRKSCGSLKPKSTSNNATTIDFRSMGVYYTGHV
jgi:hypothetical protein